MDQQVAEKKQAVECDFVVCGAEIAPTFCEEIENISGENALQCYQCGECTAGCPAAFAMEIPPNRIMRMVQLGLEDKVLQSATIWLCAGCETCAARCPRGLSVAKVMDAAREIARGRRIKPGEPKVAIFHEEFLADVARNGRAHELSLIGFYKLKSRNLFSDIPLAIKMFLKGKLAIIPKRIKGLGEVRRFFRKLK